MINKFEKQYAFLSNFSSSPIPTDEGYIASTVEHYFQAHKTLDTNEYFNILLAPSPSVAKKLGRHCKLRPDWEEVKNEIMLEALRKKFAIPSLQLKLLNTQNEYLEEGNTWNDVYWGVCNGIGKNMLGKLLMQVRQEYALDAQKKETII